MLAYILRRLALIVPTLFGIMLINFALVQFVAGGPVDQILAQLESDTDVFAGIAGGGGEIEQAGERGDYLGAQGLPEDFVADLERQFGFDKPPVERFLSMLWDYLRFDFGESYFRSISVTELILEKMPVSISLGLWTTLLAYLISIPLGIRKAVRDGTAFGQLDIETDYRRLCDSGVPVRHPVAGAVRRWLLHEDFPLRGLVSPDFADLPAWRQVLDYFWHIALPVLASTISAFATLTLLTKNSFLDEIRKQYVLTARAKGLTERRILYGHVFRNAMLIVIAGFPAVFVSVFFGSSLIIETIFSRRARQDGV